MSNYFVTEKTSRDITNTIVMNIIKMLHNRGLIEKKNLESLIEQHAKVPKDDLTYKIELDTKEKYCYIKIIKNNITAINKASGISDFLGEYHNKMCIIVVESASKKAKDDIGSKYSKAELFLEKELMINLVDNYLVPEHRLLTPEEVKVFYEEYNCDSTAKPAKILASDPVSKYYNAKRGDIFRITRPSKNSGFVRYYRIVV